MRLQVFAFLVLFLQEVAFSEETDVVDHIVVEEEHRYEWDSNGYVIFCPCMGRFGNQADHYIGALRFAKELNRTLALPPFRTYKNIPFTDWFKLGPIQQYVKAIPAEDFMSQLAPHYWPPGRRTGYCWQYTGKECKMKDGNPFGPFWDGLGVEFDDYVTYQLSYDMDNLRTVAQWNERFPSDQHPVLALRGAPGAFPVSESNRHLHKYFVWSDMITEQVDKYINETLPDGPFVGIHLRNGQDWENACSHVDTAPRFMASPQCLGWDGAKRVTKEICLPSKEDVLQQTEAIVKRINAKSLYVATDRNPMLEDFRVRLKPLGAEVFHLDPWLPQLDLAILGRSNYFIGNCVSSFTEFVKRERDVHDRPTSFWGVHEVVKNNI
ncbi:GDP-fucose protein O-fucosyltransferase 1-like isoform X1 [Corticium candelabrum]|uniref:GDP-fucose protein O-fucosyltransferase 1-like isoform X1 n=1 Tax=Corticium candelabrum TaxID=121492 RepID=UPI002E256BB9|nr:GDP-fucose protein O-fucosyltransferase 1-like isoform X1 [Corticium candelabrum]XP_062506706.1 GDP-fucose protein O-fucosyltransferase 1-like isoform X1 [Corticium candelabrum]